MCRVIFNTNDYNEYELNESGLPPDLKFKIYQDGNIEFSSLEYNYVYTDINVLKKIIGLYEQLR